MSSKSEESKEKVARFHLCLYCGKTISPEKPNSRFCSISCANLNRFKEPIERQKISISHQSEAHKVGAKKQGEKLRKRHLEGTLSVWNKGLTPQTDARVKKSTERLHLLLRTDPDYRERNAKHCREMAKAAGEKAGVVNRGRLNGKTYEELYGTERAAELKRQKSGSALELGKTVCRRCGSILTEQNLSPARRARGNTTCSSCTNTLQSARIEKELEKAYLQIFRVLGVVCSKCEYSDPRALQVDHKNGKRSKKRPLSWAYFRNLSQLPIDELKNSYQLLCANCNWIKRYEHKEGVPTGTYLAAKQRAYALACKEV